MEYQPLTETVNLPATGYEATIREGDGYAQRKVFEGNRGKAWSIVAWIVMLTDMLNGTKPTEKDICTLPQADVIYLAIRMFRLGYGDELLLRGGCEYCGKPSGHVVPLDKLPLKPLPEGAVRPDPTFETVLSRTGKRAVHGYVTYGQELEELEANGFDPIRLEYRALRTLDGKPVSYEELAALPDRDHLALRTDMHDKACGYDPVVYFTCPQCGRSTSENILADPSFPVPVRGA